MSMPFPILGSRNAKSVLVSGGTGFVGRFIVEGLLAAGYRVKVAGRHRPEAGFFSGHVDFAELDLDRDAGYERLFEGIGHFVHAAFDHLPGKYRGGEGEDAEGFRRRNLAATAKLFEAARNAGIGRAVFLSSRAVYGTQPPGATLYETTEPHPDTLYGEVKLGAEKVLLDLASVNFTPAVLRVTGVYGSAGSGHRHKWAPLFADYLAGRAIEPRAGTEVHGQDVAGATRLMLEGPSDKIAGEIFNVSDILVDRRDVLALVQRETGSANTLPKAADAGSLNVMDATKLRALGWRSGGKKLLDRTVAELVTEMRFG